MRQAAATSAMMVLGVLAVLEDRAWGIRLLSAAVVVELTLLGGLALVRQMQREHILRLIAGNEADLPLEEVSREVRRLCSPQHAAQMAGQLERILDDARRWPELAVTSRPPPGIRLLCDFSVEVDMIIGQLRAGEPAPPGVALLELMLSGSYESALYAGDKHALREQLWRIRHLLSLSSAGEDDARAG